MSPSGPAPFATSVYDRAGLPAGARIDGPAVIEQMGSTTGIAPGFTGTLDAVGNIVITLAGAPR